MPLLAPLTLVQARPVPIPHFATLPATLVLNPLLESGLPAEAFGAPAIRAFIYFKWWVYIGSA